VGDFGRTRAIDAALLQAAISIVPPWLLPPIAALGAFLDRMAALGYSRDGFAVESRWADRSIGSRKVGKGA